MDVFILLALFVFATFTTLIIFKWLIIFNALGHYIWFFWYWLKGKVFHQKNYIPHDCGGGVSVFYLRKDVPGKRVLLLCSLWGLRPLSKAEIAFFYEGGFIENFEGGKWRMPAGYHFDFISIFVDEPGEVQIADELTAVSSTLGVPVVVAAQKLEKLENYERLKWLTSSGMRLLFVCDKSVNRLF